MGGAPLGGCRLTRLKDRAAAARLQRDFSVSTNGKCPRIPTTVFSVPWSLFPLPCSLLYTPCIMQIQATGITAGYNEADVLHAVDVQVHAGEFVGLVGPNGCGKSTLLRALSRTLPCKSGSVLLDGVSI